jgi:exodeoxyribonuclease VII small subunit
VPDEPAGEELTLEGRLRRLEKIVGELETEELELDRALALFEEGVIHVRAAEEALAAAELKVEELLGEGGELRTRPLEEE